MSASPATAQLELDYRFRPVKDAQINYIPDGFGRTTTVRMVRDYMLEHGIPEPQQLLEPGWIAKVDGRGYGEMWLRYYAQCRQVWKCTVCCSQYANAVTGERKELVRDLNLDLELLLAHAKILQHTGEVVLKKGCHAL